MSEILFCGPRHCCHLSGYMKSTSGVLNQFAVKYPRVINQPTRNPRLAGKAVVFTLLHHNNARSGKIYLEFSIGRHFPLVQDIKKEQYMKT